MDAEAAYFVAVAVVSRRYPDLDREAVRDAAADGVMQAVASWQDGRGMAFKSFAAFKAVKAVGNRRWRHRIPEPRFVEVPDSCVAPPAFVDPLPFLRAWAERLEGRDQFIMGQKVAGESQEDIAVVIGVSPGRVSQIVGRLRLEWEASPEYDAWAACRDSANSGHP